jgi:hypothetical protein
MADFDIFDIRVEKNCFFFRGFFKIFLLVEHLFQILNKFLCPSLENTNIFIFFSNLQDFCGIVIL